MRRVLQEIYLLKKNIKRFEYSIFEYAESEKSKWQATTIMRCLRHTACRSLLPRQLQSTCGVGVTPVANVIGFKLLACNSSWVYGC